MYRLLKRMLHQHGLHGNNAVGQPQPGIAQPAQWQRVGINANIVAEQKSRLGEIGTTVSALRPGGKAQFGDAILDVISQGELIPKSTQVRIIAFSGREPIVEQVKTS